MESNILLEVETKIKEVEADIKKTVNEIEDATREIKALESQIAQPEPPADIQDLRRKQEQLREDRQYLCKREEQLRAYLVHLCKEEEYLRKKAEQLRKKADPNEAQARKELLARKKALLLEQLGQIQEEELQIAQLQGVDTSELDVESQEDEQLPGQETRYQFASLKQFLQKFRPPPLPLSSCVSTQTSTKDIQPPPKVRDWQAFEPDCQEQLNAVEESGPAVGFTRYPSMASVGCEAELQDQLLWCFLNPLQIAASNSFVCGRMRRDVEGLPANSGRPDFLLLSGDCNTVLVAMEVKTSAALWVPPGRSLPDVYAEAGKNSKIVKAVHQLYSYLDRVPYGVLLTDKQLFCMRREHDELLCSPSIPLTAEQGEAAAGGFGAGSLTAAAALYCTLRWSQAWWVQRRQQQPSSGSPAGGRGRRRNTADNRQRRSILQGLLPAWMGAAVAAAGAAPEPTAPRPAVVAESRCTSSQLFPGYRPDPQVPGHTPRRLAESSSAVVLQGELGGRAAAVKMVDLWQGSEGKKLLQHEARMYQALQPLQGSYVPRLLGYGSCDGWQFFVATSLEGPSLNLEDGWALGEAATRAGALAALDAVHACGVLHGDIALRNFALAASHSPPLGMGGGGAAGGAGGEGGSAGQQQPCVVLLDFGHAQLVTTAAEKFGEEPAELFRRERQELQQLLGCECPLPACAAWGAQAAAAAGNSAVGNDQEVQSGSSDICAAADGSVAANRPSRFAAAHCSQTQAMCLPPAPPSSSRPGGLGGRRQQLQPLVPRKIQWLAHHSGHSIPRAPVRSL